MKKYIIIAIGFNICFVFVTACNNKPKSNIDKTSAINKSNENQVDTAVGMNIVNEDDAQFLIEANNSTLMEIQSGNIARQKANNKKVKSIGEKIAGDHSLTIEELQTLASLKNVTLPGNLNEESRKKLDDLKKISTSEFDDYYLSQTSELHEEDIRKFEKAANNAKSPEVKTFASKLLPILRNHLDSIKALSMK